MSKAKSTLPIQMSVSSSSTIDHNMFFLVPFMAS